MFWLLSLSCLVVYGCVLPFNNVAGGILLERNFFKAPPSSCTLLHEGNCTAGSLVEGKNPSQPTGCPGKNYAPVLPSSIIGYTCSGDSSLSCNKDLYDYPQLTSSDVDCDDDFWSLGCTKDYCEGKDDASTTASKVMSIPYLMSFGLSPFLGFAVDKIGCRAILASVAPFLLFIVHLVLGLTSGSPVLPLIGQGVAYALFAAVLWPSVPFTVEPKSIGTAYGLITGKCGV